MSGIFKLTSENMTNAGLAMGMAHTFVNWTRYFPSLERAQAAALKDYREQTKLKKGTLPWLQEGSDKRPFWRSPDMGFVMYHIEEIEVES